MIDAYDLNDPDPEKRALASVLLIDDLFGSGLLDRLAKQEGCEAWLREVRARSNRAEVPTLAVGQRARRSFTERHKYV